MCKAINKWRAEAKYINDWTTELIIKHHPLDKDKEKKIVKEIARRSAITIDMEIFRISRSEAEEIHKEESYD